MAVGIELLAGSAEAQAPVPPARAQQQQQFVGVGSCAAAGCHGGDGSRKHADGSFNFSSTSFSTWVQQDPHSRAYDVLLNERSRKMVRQLGAGWQAAHQEQRCLACHSSLEPGAAMPASDELLLDGVSCESCHGPAEKWLIPHTDNRTWRGQSHETRTALGFVDLRTNLALRGETCAKCHVGGPGRDVNHDLLAAGHPRLNFELSAHHANLPAHWDIKQDEGAFPSPGQPQGSALEAKLWVVGQLTTAEAALKLLEARAAAATTAPWPEFSEYGCFACHHDLQAPSWRQQNPVSGRIPGRYPWGTWNYSLLTILDPAPTASPLGEALKGLEKTLGRPLPVASEVLTQSKVARGLMAAELARYNAPDSLTAERIRQLLQRVTHDGQKLAERDWDAAAQVYLATAALHQGRLQATGQVADQQVIATLETLRGQLQFPQPPEAPVELSSPRNFDAKRIIVIRAQLQKLEKLIQRP